MNSTKERILDVSLELFSQRGYSAVSIRDICKCVGIKESSVYYHFENKQNIFDVLLDRFYEIAKGLETCPEGGERCFRCYALRLEKTAQLTKEGGYDYFTTTLTISPLKNAAKLNEIGEEMASKYETALEKPSNARTFSSLSFICILSRPPFS